jgi:hypothetical protein
MREVFKRIGIAVVLLGLMSCEGGTEFSKYIVNQSSDTLFVKGAMQPGTSDSVRVLPGSRELVYWFDLQGVFPGEAYECSSDIDSLRVTASSGRNIVKKIKSDDNWYKEHEEGRNATVDCIFIISNEDLK